MSTFTMIAMGLITILSASRITRLVVFDKFPPVRYLRNRYLDALDGGYTRRKWQLLVLCGYCFAIYPTIAIVAWGYLSNWHDPWWLVNGCLAASYLAAVFMAADLDTSSSEEDD